MKFNKDDMGWRDLKHVDTDNVELQVSIPDRKATYTAVGKPYICIIEGGTYASLHLSRAQLKTLANKILKELDRK